MSSICSHIDGLKLIEKFYLIYFIKSSVNKCTVVPGSNSEGLSFVLSKRIQKHKNIRVILFIFSSVKIRNGLTLCVRNLIFLTL